MRSIFLASLAALSLMAAAPAAADVVDVSSSQDFSGGAGFNSYSYTFELPTDYVNAVLSIENFDADDRAVLQLNGTIVSDTGIGGPGSGLMQLTSGGPNDPYVFSYGNESTLFASVLSGFVSGTNTLTIILNDTWAGIQGQTVGQAGPSAFYLDATVSFQRTGAVPEPGTWAMMLLGFGAIGVAVRRRRAPVSAMAS